MRTHRVLKLMGRGFPFRWVLPGLLVLLVVSSTPVFAQSTATLQGTVTDPSGAVVPNAKIVVRNQGTGVGWNSETGGSGNFQVPSLPVGTYSIEVRAQGFQTRVIKDLRLEVGQTVVQNLQLEVGAISQEVVVSGTTPLVETATVTVGHVIDQHTVQDIPLNGRHFVDLGLLIPGSVTPPQNGFLTAPLRGQGSFQFNTAGNREDTVNYTINGINLNDMVQNQITFQPSINTVQEFKVNNSTFSAEYGRNSGAIALIATRSGANAFHGEAFEFVRNDNLDARNFFAKDIGAFHRNQFGGAIGGPIRRNKSFFFFTYEGLRQRQGITLNSGVLSGAQRASVTDPGIQKLVALLPTANATDAKGAPRFFGSAVAPVNIDQWTGDVNHTFTENERLHAYYAIQRDKRQEPVLQGNTIPNFGDTRQARRQIFTLNENHTFGPGLVNEARLGFNRIHITFTPNAQLNPTDFGIDSGISGPIGLPQIAVGGIGLNFGGPAGFPQGRGDLTAVLSDTATWLRGKHSLKIGGEFRRFYNNNFNGDTGALTFPDVKNFISGNATVFSITLGDRASSVSTTGAGIFVQDHFQWRRNLTLELGLRYDANTRPTEKHNRFVVFDPSTASLVRVGSGIGEVYDTNNKDFQPRLGFVWDPFKSGKTSVRGAYAILFEQPVTNMVIGLTANPPLATPVAFTGPGTVSIGNALTAAKAGGLAPSTVEHGFVNAYNQSWNLNIQREITSTFGVMVGYFGSKGTHLRISRNINQIASGVRPFPKLSATGPILPGSTLGNIATIDSGSNSNYNALWVAANKRLSHGLQFNASYTRSKSIDNNSLSSQGVVVQDSFGIRNDRGLSDFDARNRFVINWLYELPFRGRRLTEGWQLSSIIQAQGGNPVTILAGNPLAIPGTKIGGANIASFTGLGTIRPDLVGSIAMPRTATQWFVNSVCDPRGPGGCLAGTVFALPVSLVGGASVFHFGGLGRNTIIGPRFYNADFSILKNTRISEQTQIQFRAEFFDIFNHANFGQPGRVAQVGSTVFGVITNTRFPTGDSGSSRQIQFALKLIF